MKNKKKVWTIVAGAGATAAVLVPGIVYASLNTNSNEVGEGISVPASKSPAKLPSEKSGNGISEQSVSSAGHSFSAVSANDSEKNSLDDFKNVQKVSAVSPISADSPASAVSSNSPASPVSPISAQSPVSANSPASPVSAQSPVSANSPASPVSAASSNSPVSPGSAN